MQPEFQDGSAARLKVVGPLGYRAHDVCVRFRLDFDMSSTPVGRSAIRKK